MVNWAKMPTEKIKKLYNIARQSDFLKLAHKGKSKMVSAALLRNEDELKEFYEFLLYRAQEEEGNGNDNYASIYRELAEGVKKQIECY